MMAAYFLTPIYTSSEKRQLISDHIKGPLIAGTKPYLIVHLLAVWTLIYFNDELVPSNDEQVPNDKNQYLIMMNLCLIIGKQT